MRTKSDYLLALENLSRFIPDDHSFWSDLCIELEWEVFGERFVAALAGAVGVSASSTPWPDLNEDEVEGLIEQYSQPEWLDYR